MGQLGIVGPQGLPVGRIRVDVSEEIDKLNLDVNKLMLMSDKMGKTGVGDMTFNWMNKERMSEFTDIVVFGGLWAAGALSPSGTFDVKDADRWKFAVGDLIRIPGSEAQPISEINIYITAVGIVGSGDTGAGYTLISGKSYDSSTAQDFQAATLAASNPTALAPVVNGIYHVSNSFELGTGMGTIKSYQPVPESNHIQIVQTPYGTLTTMEHLDMQVGGLELAENEETAKLEHEFMKEKLAFFGQKHKATVGYMNGAYEQYFTGGLIEAVQSNVSILGAMTRTEFDAWINQAIYYAENPVVFAGERVYGALSTWLGATLETTQNESTLGIAVSTYKTIYGDTVQIVPHREVFRNAYAGYAFSVDLKDFGYRFLNGLDTHIEVDIQAPDLKMKINEVRTWLGFWVGNEKRHGMLKCASIA